MARELLPDHADLISERKALSKMELHAYSHATETLRYPHRDCVLWTPLFGLYQAHEGINQKDEQAKSTKSLKGEREMCTVVQAREANRGERKEKKGVAVSRECRSHSDVTPIHSVVVRSCVPRTWPLSDTASTLLETTSVTGRFSKRAANFRMGENESVSARRDAVPAVTDRGAAAAGDEAAAGKPLVTALVAICIPFPARSAVG